MRSENTSIWYLPANEGRELAILIKIPAPTIKALLAGCSFQLTFGLKDSVLCTGARFFDVPDFPLSISGAQRHGEEHLALKKILEAQSCPLFLFNEMDVCVAWTNIRIDGQEAESIQEFIGDFSDLYVGPFLPETEQTLDCFCSSVDETDHRSGAQKIRVTKATAEPGEWKTTRSYFLSARESHEVAIDSSDEGETLERVAWASLESVFPRELFKNPQLQKGAKYRELTDVLAFYEHGTFLVESKDLSVLQAGIQRSMSRRLSGVIKQVEKGISQLVGACRGLRNNLPVRTCDLREEIEFDRANTFHCIVLITELSHSGEWSGIEEQLIEAIMTTGAHFHLLDLPELILLLKASSGDPEVFHYNLIRRSEIFLEEKSVHIRSRVPGSEQGE